MARPGPAALIAWAVLAACSNEHGNDAPAAPSVAEVQASPTPNVVTPPPFMIVESATEPAARTPDGCVVLEVQKQWHTLKYRRGAETSCPTFAEAQPMLREMVMALNAVGHLAGLTSFDAGREYTAYFERLSLAALRSTAWDVGAGRPKQGTSNAFVVDVSRPAATFFPEVEALLEGTGLTPELHSVEKVLVGTPSETPFAQSLTAAGASAGDKLPYDCLLVFRLVTAG